MKDSPNAYYVSLFFPLKQEAQVRMWYLDKQPGYWIYVSSIHGKPSYFLSKPQERNVWHASVLGITNGWRWWLLASGGPYDPTENLSDDGSDPVVKNMLALKQPGSPVQHTRRLVSLFVSFRPHK